MDRAAEEVISYLQLEPHPEGGFFRQTYRSEEQIETAALPERYGGPRPFSTSIYFLLPGDQVSRLHRLRSDEVWHFYEGSGVRIHLFEDDGRYRELRLGADRSVGEEYQVVVPGECWFGATVTDSSNFALVGCTVAPGFEFADFTMEGAKQLRERFPAHRELIDRLL